MRGRRQAELLNKALFVGGLFFLLSRRGNEMIFDPVEFGERLKETRKLRGITQEQLAEKLNIGLDHMKSIERGRRSCSIDLLLLISELLNVSADYLLSGKGPDLGKKHQQIDEIMDLLTELKQDL